MAVGQRVFVNAAGNRSESVALADQNGKVLSAVHLADGAEVEVVAWRPRGTSETRYRVRTPNGADGWLPAENLRAALIRLPPPEAPNATQATTVADAGGRRFGQQSHIAHPPSSGSPAPALPAPGASGRRFGQHFETAGPPASGSPTPALPTPALPAPGAGGRRFGQHFETAGPPASGSPTPALPAPVVNSRGRRFGQRF